MKYVGLNCFMKEPSFFIPRESKLIGIAGGSGSGKSYVANGVSWKLGARVLSVDDYIIPEMIKSQPNWDLPECWNLELLSSNLNDFSNGKDFEKPVYDFPTGEIGKYETVEAGGRLVVEGLYLPENLDCSIFVDSPEEVRLKRVIDRYFRERSGYNADKITRRWNQFVQPMFEENVYPQMNSADLIVLN